MFGKGQSGWGLAPTMHALDVIVGSIAWKPVVVEGRIEPREILNLTMVFDHDVVDGAPAARCTPAWARPLYSPRRHNAYDCAGRP